MRIAATRWLAAVAEFLVRDTHYSDAETDIEWKLVYVGSAENVKMDQELDACMVGPVPAGVNSFEFEVWLPSLCAVTRSDS